MEEKRAVYSELWNQLRFKESMWRQKSRILWLKEGDRNTKFFHAKVKGRSKRNAILGLNKEGKWIAEPIEVKKMVFEHFKNHFEGQETDLKVSIDLPFLKLSVAEAASLEVPILIDEVKEAIWSCESSKAPGPDGFNFSFYKKAWHFIKEDLMRFVGEFYSTGILEKGINSSFIALIPKVDCLGGLKDYRPICLVNSMYKILAKILARRLKANIGKVISDTQSAFIEGRQILDGILLANEIIDLLKKHRKRDGGIILKLDFEKAYDCVNWKCLDFMMRSMGFGYKWREWIMECISTVGISVLVNGSTTKQFRMERGLRQGDPLSPLLFLMVVEMLHQML